MAFTDPSNRGSSRIYQDLWSTRLHSIVGGGISPLPSKSTFNMEANAPVIEFSSFNRVIER